MAATLRDIKEMLARNSERQKPKPERHTEAGIKMAFKILHDFEFPGGTKEIVTKKKKID